MATAKKATTKKASPFSVSNKTAAFNPPKSKPFTATRTTPSRKNWVKKGSAFAAESTTFGVTELASRGQTAAQKKAAAAAAKKKAAAAAAAKKKQQLANAAKAKANADRGAKKPVPYYGAYGSTNPAVKNQGYVAPSQGAWGAGSGTVAKGDTLWSFAKREAQKHGIAQTNANINKILQRIISINPRFQKNPNLIKPGEFIRW
jgi:hypothetical protein